MTQTPLQFDGFILDLAAGMLLRDDGTEIPLQPLVYRLLLKLLEQPGALVTHEQLMQHLWPGVHVTEDSLSQAVRRLRKALGSADLVKTVPRRGYRWGGEVSQNLPSPPPAPRARGLRLPPDRFIGRAEELAELARRLDAGERLITLTGPAGVGKTRLARMLAASRPGPVWFVELQTAAGAADVLREVARAVGAREGANAAEIGLRLADSPGLLVLDDFERLIAPARELVGGWHEAAPALAQIVTSRAVLGLPGERVVSLAPLPADDAAALFADRADLPPGEAGIAELMEALDRLPLAIELAAARARVLAPMDMLAALRERFKVLKTASGAASGRHRSLAAALDDSWALLSDGERQALTELSTFLSPFHLEDASAVLTEPQAALDRVQALVDHSLLQVLPERRFALLPTVRDYVEERGEPEVRRAAEIRHGRWLARLGEGEQFWLVLDSPADGPWQRLREALDDLVAACRRAIARGDASVAGPTALAAGTVLSRTGPYELWVELLEGANRVAKGRDLGVLGWLGVAYLHTHRVEEALAARTAARALALAEGRAQGAALQAVGMASALQYLGRPDEARALLNDARDAFASLGDLYNEGVTHQNLAGIALQECDSVAAFEHVEAAIALYRSAGAERGLAAVLQQRAIELEHRGRLAEAEAAYAEALEILQRRSDRVGAGMLRLNLAAMYGRTGQSERSVALSREAVAELRAVGRPYLEAMAWSNLASALSDLERYREAEEAAHQALQIGRALDSIDSVARGLITLACVRRLVGEPGEASALAAQAEEVLSGPERRGSAFLLAAARLERAEAALALGEPQAALQWVAQAEPVLRSGWRTASIASLLALKAEALTQMGELDAAEVALAEAEQATSLVGHGRLARRLAEARRKLGR